MYTLHIDQEKIFECQLKIQGTSLKKSRVSLVVEKNDGVDVRFKGEINENGTVNIQIKRLDNLLNEGDTGVLYLEVIAEDAYFVPFKSEYVTKVVRKVAMETPLVEVTKKLPTVDKISVTEVKIVEPTEPFSPKKHVDVLLIMLKENKLNILNKNHRSRAFALIAEYVVDKGITDTEQTNIVIDSLLKKVVGTTNAKVV